MARKILLADDSVTAQNMGRKILADAGYDIVTVNNGSAALKRIAEIKPDLIVLDVYMPGYSGLEVCQRLKDSPETAHIPVLLTVGKLEPFKPEEARRVKADAHIVKPFEASELLTAITRLEDRMVPQQSDGGRFSSSAPGVERFGNDSVGKKKDADGETDTGWKSRLRFPTKKKKEEVDPEPDDAAAEANYRDYRKGKGKVVAGGAFSIKPPAPAGQEPGLVPDIPRDITPDELDALSAVAAKLDGLPDEPETVAIKAETARPEFEVAVAVAETIQSPASGATAETVTSASTAVIQDVAPAAVSSSVIEAREIEPQEKETDSTETDSLEVPSTMAGPAFAAGSMNEIEIPVGRIEPEAEAAIDDPVSAEPTAAVEIPLTLVNTASLAEGPAPVERADEPRFATVARADSQGLEAIAESSKKESEEVQATAVGASAIDAASGMQLPSEVVVAQHTEARIGPDTQEVEVEKLKAEEALPPVATSVTAPQATSIDEPAPTEAELAEALRLLTPATGSVEVASIPSHGTLVAAGQLLAEEAARNASAGPRWIAEAVALSPEDASLSLEDEMFRTYATTSPSMSSEAAPTMTSGDTAGLARITGVSAITAAVESRMAEAARASNPKRIEEPQAPQSSENSAESMAGASATRVASETTITSGGGNEQATATATAETTRVETAVAEEAVVGVTVVEPAKIESSEVVAEQKESSTRLDDENPAQEVAAATFADAVSNNHDSFESQPEHKDSLGGVAAAELVKAEIAEENQNSNLDPGGEESMAKSGKSTWHQIRTTPTSTATGSNLVEAAKQEAANEGGAKQGQGQGSDEAPKAMAAAAAADGSSFASSTDSSAIASIVDSVMADLRPKIVEEIAKKLAGK